MHICNTCPPFPRLNCHIILSRGGSPSPRKETVNPRAKAPSQSRKNSTENNENKRHKHKRAQSAPRNRRQQKSCRFVDQADPGKVHGIKEKVIFHKFRSRRQMQQPHGQDKRAHTCQAEKNQRQSASVQETAGPSHKVYASECRG